MIWTDLVTNYSLAEMGGYWQIINVLTFENCLCICDGDSNYHNIYLLLVNGRLNYYFTQ